MGEETMMKLQIVARLCEAAADLIAEHPQAAAKVARSLAQMFREEHQEEIERTDRDRAEMRQRGF